MVDIAYYNSGVPYDASGHPIIIITGGPATVSTNGVSPVPVYTPFPLGPVPMGGGIAYDPKKLPKVTSYSSLLDMGKKIDALLASTNKIYPANLAQIKSSATALLTKAGGSIAANDTILKASYNKLKTSLDALNKAVSDEEAQKTDLANKTKIAQDGFNASVKLWKLENMLNHPDYFDIVFTTSPNLSKAIAYWEEHVTKTRNAQYLSENQYITIRNRVMMISRDVSNNINALSAAIPPAEQREKDSALKGTSQLILDSASGISKKYGQTLGVLANDISSTVKGKTIRSYNDAMSTFEKISSNPGIKLSQADKKAIATAMNAFNIKTYADNLNRLGKAFGFFDKGFTGEKIYQGVSSGFNTGDWKPLMLTVESLALSGVAASITTQFISGALLAIPALGISIPTIPDIGLTIIIAGLISSLFDEKMAQKLNDNIIPSAY
ncbi:colicin-like pore-forming protein [Enterobacteriaceae bacterium LUAb1]